jgi:hypothetical protein
MTEEHKHLSASLKNLHRRERYHHKHPEFFIREAKRKKRAERKQRKVAREATL